MYCVGKTWPSGSRNFTQDYSSGWVLLPAFCTTNARCVARRYHFSRRYLTRKRCPELQYACHHDFVWSPVNHPQTSCIFSNSDGPCVCTLKPVVAGWRLRSPAGQGRLLLT